MSHPVFIATFMRPSGETGVQTHFQTFSTWLKKTNKTVRIITPFSVSKWKVYPVFGIRLLVKPINSTASVWWYRYWHFFFLKKALRSTLKNGTPCIVYAQCPLSAYAAMQTRNSASQRVFLVTHFNISQADEWAEKGEIKHNGRLFNSIRKLEEETLPALDGIVFVSDFMRRQLLSRIPELSATTNKVIPNFIAPPALNLQDKDKVISDLICIGTLEPRKNQRYALEIIAAAKRLGHTLSLTLIGDGPDRADLEAAAENLDISSQVKFLGYIEEAANYIPQHRAYLHVSRMESFGIVLIEAMSRGLPVFAPAVGGIPEVFTDGVEGRFIPLNSAETSAKLIIEWLESPSTLSRAGCTARERYFSNFEADSIASDLFSFISALDAKNP